MNLNRRLKVENLENKSGVKKCFPIYKNIFKFKSNHKKLLTSNNTHVSDRKLHTTALKGPCRKNEDRDL